MDMLRTHQQASSLVWINGYAGVGKLTVARELVRLYRPGEALLIDNHQLIDPVAARIQRGDPHYYIERQKERQKAFERWVLSGNETQRVFIFTGKSFAGCCRFEARTNSITVDCQSDNELGRDVSKEYQDVAAKSKRQFIPVLLDCDHDENIKRATSVERRISRTTKLAEPDLLKKIRKEEDMLTFGLPSELILDITNLSPAAAARLLHKHIAALNTV